MVGRGTGQRHSNGNRHMDGNSYMDSNSNLDTHCDVDGNAHMDSDMDTRCSNRSGDTTRFTPNYHYATCYHFDRATTANGCTCSH